MVTGIGIVSPVGQDIATAWENLVSGCSGIGFVSKMNAENFPSRIAGEVLNFDAEAFLSRKEMRHMDVFIHYGLVAAGQAIADSGLSDSNIDCERVGVSIGSGIGGLPMIENSTMSYAQGGPKKISPFFVPATIINMISGHVSIRYGYRGPNIALSTACTTATHCIGEGLRKIQYGDADVMIVGGAEATITGLALGGFSMARALSTRNDEPERASRPWDKDRDGFVLGEGAGVLVLEAYEHAYKRNANVYAEVIGYGMSADAHHMTAPPQDGSGAQLCMTNALKDAAINPDEVSYINAHGTSTPLGDIAETRGIKKCFGEECAHQLMISSTKSMTGHLLGAAGGIEAIFTIQALKKQIVPPTINLDEADPECDLDYVPNTARSAKLDIGLSNSFGFGGTNATLVFRRI